MTRKLVGFILLATSVCVTPLSVSDDAAFDRANLKRAGIDFQSRVVLNRAIANHWRKLPILVLARPNRSEAAAERLLALGGEVHFTSHAIDYIRGIIPTASVNDYFLCDDVQEIRLGYFSIGLWDLDKAEPRSRPAPPESKEDKVNAHPPAKESEMPLLSAKEMGAENPYLPTRDIGAPQFVREHPGFDGRGVTIAILEMADLDHPTLRTARTLDGTLVPKVAGILNSYDPDHNEMLEAGLPIEEYAGMREADSVVRMQTLVETHGVEFEQQGQRYIAPMPGSYRFGEFQQRHGDGSRTTRVGVLWQPLCHCVWVDTNGNHSFADEKAIRDFNQTHDLSYFPQSGATETGPASPGQITDPGLEDVDFRETATTAFAVTIDEIRHIVYVFSSDSDHGTMVASVAAGKGFLGGEANGVAPEAQILYVSVDGNRVDRIVEGALLAAQDPRVDVITSSQGAATIPEDGESLLSVAMDRIVNRFRKPILQGAGNHQWPGMEQVMEHAAAAEVLGVGGYNHGSTRNAIYSGSRFSESKDYVSWFSANGPSSIGALKPDFLAPNLEVAAMPCSLRRRPQPEFYLVASFRLPRCYWVGGGTSSAAPFAAGAIALLISAAKQSRIPYDTESLYWAMRMGTRRLPDYGTYQQGSGLIQVGKAWALLREYRNRPPVKIAFSAPIRIPLARYLKIQRGVGLFENGGWVIGEQGVRLVKILRRGGSERQLPCRLELIGNDGSFAVPNTTDLPAGREVELPVRIHITTAGVHDAILRIVDTQTRLPIDQTALTVVAGNTLRAENGYTYDLHAVLRPEESQTAFVEIPFATSALKVQLKVFKGNVHLFGEAPSFLGGWFPLKQYLYPAQWTHSQQQPEPGVWQFRIDDFEHGHEDLEHFTKEAEFVLHIEAQGPGPIPPTDKGTRRRSAAETSFAAIRNPVSIRHQGFLHAVAVTSLGSPAVFDMEIPKQTESLFLGLDAIGADGTPNADVYLYECTGSEMIHQCRLWDICNLRSTCGSFFIRWPEAGLWKALIDPLSRSSFVDLQVSQVIAGPAPGKILLVTQQGADSADSQAESRAATSARVDFVEVIDPASEHEEEMSPLRDFARYPSSDFLPVPLSIAVGHY